MVDVKVPSVGETATKIEVAFGGVSDSNLKEITVRELIMSESLLTPGLQTSVLVDSFLHATPKGINQTEPPKNYDDYKGKIMSLKIERPVLEYYDMTSIMEISQRIYRIDSRKLINNNNEQFRVHACDDSLLNDARTLVSKSWKCTSPSSIVSEVLRSCVGVSRTDVEQSTPMRDYIAENIHPFQVITQQANAALAQGNDPSFVHYMTYENFGTHHFRSILSLSKQLPVISRPFVYSETGVLSGYANPYSILTYSFPCDFDLLSDILNGIDTDGSEINSLTTFNPLAGIYSLFGNQAMGCGMGGGVYNISKTNQSTEQAQDMCKMEVEKYLLKRQARMSLLEQDKIALRLTIPWNPMLHAGKIIQIELARKGSSGKDLLYGSGKYLIVNMIHNVKNGGYSTTTMECVAQTAGQGIV
jgi:hypothetical protein